jgi:hypothetical protein
MKNKDAELYAVLVDKIDRFIQLDKLVDIAHGMDTNVNEAFNQICTWFCPKNKVYCGSGSLANRLSMAVGINSVGVEVFFVRLYEAMGITVSPNVIHFMKVKDTTRNKRLAALKTKEAKLNKNKKKFDKLKDDTKMAKIEFRKRAGTYRTCMNVMDDPFDDPPPDQLPPAKKRKTVIKYCEYCSAKGHVTKKSKKCTAEASSMKRYSFVDGSLLPGCSAVAVLAQPHSPAVAVVPSLDDILSSPVLFGPLDADDDADDADRTELLPLNCPPPRYDDSDDEFFEADTWSDCDEPTDDDVVVVGGTL